VADDHAGRILKGITLCLDNLRAILTATGRSRQQGAPTAKMWDGLVVLILLCAVMGAA
jgi:hypothetical protein